jgi:hypothetical protein
LGIFRCRACAERRSPAYLAAGKVQGERPPRLAGDMPRWKGSMQAPIKESRGEAGRR